MDRLRLAARLPRQGDVVGFLACALLATLFLAPAIRQGAFGPADMLLTMTPWAQYRDQFPAVRGVGNPQLDVIQQYVPWRLFASRQLAEGVLPLWNPHAYCGQPLLANVLSAVFYPPTWLALVLPIGVFFLLSAWLHLVLLGFGLWLLLRDYGLRGGSALAGAVVMMFNTFVVGWLAYPNLSQWTYAWAPLLLFCWRRAWLTRRPRRLVFTAALLALVGLGGHVQIAFYVALAWLVYAAANVLAEGRGRDLLVYVVLPAALAGGLVAAQLLPAFEMAGLSGRTGQSYADAVASRVPLAMLGQLLAPWLYGHNALDLFGTGSGGLYWGPYTNGVEASISAGAAALWLALLAVAWRRRRETWIFAAIALLGLALALGTPLYWLFYRFVPGFSSLRGLSRSFAMVNLGLAALAGFGAEALLGEAVARPARGRVAALVLVGASVGLVTAWLAEALRSGPEVLNAFTAGLTDRAVPYMLQQSALALVVSTAVALAAWRATARWGRWVWLLPAAELLALGWPLHRGAPPELFFFETPETRYLAAHAADGRLVGHASAGRPSFLDWMPMNTPMAYGISSPCGSESLSFAAYSRLMERFWRQDSFAPVLGHPLLNLVGARYVLSRAELAGQAGLRRVAGERCGVYENPAALPRVFATSRWHRGDETLLAELAGRPGYDPREVVVPANGPTPEVTAPPAASWYYHQAGPQRCRASGRTESRSCGRQTGSSRRSRWAQERTWCAGSTSRQRFASGCSWPSPRWLWQPAGGASRGRAENG
ncbi:MAG: hypothetical protein HUU35_08725 [Armatimonadetes bacterium]|nr:hypothetical protein [Armatimonadota bacterium]